MAGAHHANVVRHGGALLLQAVVEDLVTLAVNLNIKETKRHMNTERPTVVYRWSNKGSVL
jgi:hypothetical protein